MKNLKLGNSSSQRLLIRPQSSKLLMNSTSTKNFNRPHSKFLSSVVEEETFDQRETAHMPLNSNDRQSVLSQNINGSEKKQKQQTGVRVRPQTAFIKQRQNSMRSVNTISNQNVFSTKSSNHGGQPIDIQSNQAHDKSSQQSLSQNSKNRQQSKSRNPTKDWKTMHRLCKKPHLPNSQQLGEFEEIAVEEKSLLSMILDKERKQGKYEQIQSTYSMSQLSQQKKEQSRNQQTPKIPIILSTNDIGDKTGKSDIHSLSVKSTLSLRQNELKIIRNFKIDYNQYQTLKNDEERRKFLISKMENDIRENLESIQKNLEQKMQQFESAQQVITSQEPQQKDTYPWLQIQTKNPDLQPKLKQKLMETYQTLQVSLGLQGNKRNPDLTSITQSQNNKRDSLFNQYNSQQSSNSNTMTAYQENQQFLQIIDSIKFIVPPVPSDLIPKPKSLSNTQKQLQLQNQLEIPDSETKLSQLSSKILVSGANLSMALNKTFKQFVHVYTELHDKQQNMLNREKSGRFLSNRLVSLKLQNNLVWTDKQELQYTTYRQQMKRNLTKETNSDAWDNVMMGAFNKVFSSYGQKYQKLEVVQEMRRMNFEQINQFLSTLQTLNNCTDKDDFQKQVDNIEPDILHKIETELAQKIIEEYEVQKQEIKDARFHYLKLKNRKIAQKVENVQAERDKKQQFEQRRKENIKFVKRIKIILNGVEKKLIDIKEKKPTRNDELYKEHRNWSKKVKKPEIINLNPANSDFRGNEAALNQMVFSYFQNEKGAIKQLKFDSNHPEEYFQMKYTGGPDAIEKNLIAIPGQNNQGAANFLRLGALNNAARQIQKAFKRFKLRKHYESIREQEARDKLLFQNKQKKMKMEEARAVQKLNTVNMESIVMQQLQQNSQKAGEIYGVRDFLINEKDKREKQKEANFYMNNKKVSKNTVEKPESLSSDSESDSDSSSNSSVTEESIRTEDDAEDVSNKDQERNMIKGNMKKKVQIIDNKKPSKTDATEQSDSQNESDEMSQENSDTTSAATGTQRTAKNSRAITKKKIKKQKDFEFKAFSFFIKPQQKLVYMQSGGQEKIYENPIISQNEKLQFNPTLEPNPKKRFKKCQLTARQDNIIKCAKINNVTYIMKNKDILTAQDLNVRDGDNNTALYYAVQNSYYEVTKVLLDLGANVNLKNSLGNTCLHKAFMTRNMLVINLLLSRNADITILNDFMQTPLYFSSTQMINELGLSKHVTHYLNYKDFEVNFVETEEIKEDIHKQDVVNKRMAHRIKYT
eukprot:403359072